MTERIIISKFVYTIIIKFRFMQQTLTLKTPFGPLEIEGKHVYISFIAGAVVGAIVLFGFQKKTGKLLPAIN